MSEAWNLNASTTDVKIKIKKDAFGAWHGGMLL